MATFGSFCSVIFPAFRIDSDKYMLPEIHNEHIQYQGFAQWALLWAVLGRSFSMGYMCGNNLTNIWHTSDLFLIYPRKIKSAAVKSALADVLALNNL